MKKFLSLLMLLSSSLSWGQLPDISKQDVYELLGGIMVLPLNINTDGEFSFSAGKHDLAFNPVLHFAHSNRTLVYSLPQKPDTLGLMPPSNTGLWVEFKKNRSEIGLGPGAMQNATFTLGLVPFKGAYNQMVRFKTSQDEVTPKAKLPESLRIIDEWNVGEYGSFQTYGGIEAYAGVGKGIINLAQATLTIQNQFKISIKKKSVDNVEFSIEEEHINRKEIKFGPLFVNAKKAWVNGSLFSAQFTLNLLNPEHQNLYQIALEGNIKELQRRLPLDSQRVTWKGNDRATYYGFPFLYGQSRSASHYEYEEQDTDGDDPQVDLFTRQNQGLLSIVGIHKRFIYQNQKSIMLYWTSEMGRASYSLLNRKFLRIMRQLGLENAEELSRGRNLGAINSVVGVSLTRSEIERVRGRGLTLVDAHLREHCEELALSCAKDKKRSKLLAKVSKALALPWEESRRELGKLLLDEPVLIKSITRAINVKKDVFVRFLSENYQSWEGLQTIEP